MFQECFHEHISHKCNLRIGSKCDHREHLGFRSDSEELRRGEEVRIALTNQLRFRYAGWIFLDTRVIPHLMRNPKKSRIQAC